MYYAVGSNGMKQIDDYTVHKIKIPALVLMERAALNIVDIMKRYIRLSDRILVVCGPGNNGGDGIAAGRILSLQGYHVAILFIGDEFNATEQTKMQLEIVKNLGVTMENNNKLHEYNIIIDSIFGVGLSRSVTGDYEDIIHKINQSQNKVFSVDIPSGISADSGKVMNVAVKADYTITFGFQKIGLILYPGASYAGSVIVSDIGFPQIATDFVSPNSFYYDVNDLKRLPQRQDYSNKGTYGKVLVIAGNIGMSGAAYLSAKAAYRSGTGLVKILTHSENRLILQTSLPEALFESYDNLVNTSGELDRKLVEIIRWASVIVIGPGLGQTESVEQLLDIVIEQATVPVIIDADAINMLAKKLDRETIRDSNNRLGRLQEILKDNTILTPHIKELSRLLATSVEEISYNIIDSADQCSYNNKLIYAIKDARTIVTHNNRKYINTSGNHGMATGGSGDVLTGIVAGLIAQGMDAYEATCMAVYVHGLTGDIVAKEKGTYSLMASDLVDSIQQVIHDNRKG